MEASPLPAEVADQAVANNPVPTSLPSDVSWYEIDTKDAVGDAARRLLENWGGIPKDNVDSHVYEVREKAYKIYPYPCIGLYRFLDLAILTMPGRLYADVLSRLKSGAKLLDLGCCFGQEIRHLAFDGAPSENLYGSDLRPEFIQLGYDLFRDKETLKATFIAADVFDPKSPLKRLEGQMDIVYTGSFFHLFDWQGQYAVAKRVAELLKPEPGSLLIGRQVGNENPGEYPRRAETGDVTRYRHDARTWKEMWDKVGQETGTNWDVKAELDPFILEASQMSVARKLFASGREPGIRRLRFVVKRV